MWSSCVVNQPFTLGRTSLLACHPTATTPKSLKLTRSSLSDYPLASRIMVRNLPYSTNESCLKKEFSNFGEIAEVDLIKDKETNRSKGYAFIQYTCQNDAVMALEEMDCQYYEGRVISVELARASRNMFGGSPITSGPPAGSDTITQEKEED